MMRMSPAPSALIAWMYSSCRTTRTCPRTIRAIPAQPTIPIDEEKQCRKREGDVGEPHHDLIDPSTIESGDQAQRDAERERDSLRNETNGQRDARAVYEPGPDVPSLNVRPQPVLRRRSLEEMRQIDRDRILPRDEGSENGSESHDDDDPDPDASAVVAQESLTLFGI
jgi:hypothetical protein